MFDFRDFKTIPLNECQLIKEDSTAYIYTDPILHKNYVLKTFEGDLNDPYLLTEFRKMMLLSAEPEIGTAYGLVTVQNGNSKQPGYLMEYIKGKSLKDIVVQDISFEFDQYIEIISQIAKGMEKAHHYEVFHNDLQLHNVILDEFQNVKIIDFLWNDYSKLESTAAANDVHSFKQIQDYLFWKLPIEDQRKAVSLRNYSIQISNFKGVSAYILSVSEICHELSRITSRGQQVIGYLINYIPEDFKLTHVVTSVFQDSKVSQKLIPAITELEVSRAKDNEEGKVVIRYSDSRLGNIRIHLDNHLIDIFHQLNQANLCNYKVIVTGDRQFYGPYSIRLEINIGIKLLKWQKINRQFPFFLNITEDEFEANILSDEWVRNPFSD